jgi:hypothetical protein
MLRHAVQVWPDDVFDMALGVVPGWDEETE